MIEYQNEFCTVGGGLYESVRESMEETGMLEHSAAAASEARRQGALIVHAPLTGGSGADGHHNQHLGIMRSLSFNRQFLPGSWGAAICIPVEADDVVLANKKGLDAFAGTQLEALLRARGVETVVLCGFLANVCVESTMRTAYELGFHTITLHDCVAATSAQALLSSTQLTYRHFSESMSSTAWVEGLRAASSSCSTGAAEPAWVARRGGPVRLEVGDASRAAGCGGGASGGWC